MFRFGQRWRCAKTHLRPPPVLWLADRIHLVQTRSQDFLLSTIKKMTSPISMLKKSGGPSLFIHVHFLGTPGRSIRVGDNSYIFLSAHVHFIGFPWSARLISSSSSRCFRAFACDSGGRLLESGKVGFEDRAPHMDEAIRRAAFPRLVKTPISGRLLFCFWRV